MWTNCAKNLKYENPRIGISLLLCVPFVQMDGQKDVGQLGVPFPHSFANASENQAYLLMVLGFYDVFTRSISDEVDAS